MILGTGGFMEENNLYKYLNASIMDCIQANQLQRLPGSEAGSLIIAFLHGLSMLAIDKKFAIHSKSELLDYLGDLILRFLNNMKGYSMV